MVNPHDKEYSLRPDEFMRDSIGRRDNHRQIETSRAQAIYKRAPVSLPENKVHPGVVRAKRPQHLRD